MFQDQRCYATHHTISEANHRKTLRDEHLEKAQYTVVYLEFHVTFESNTCTVLEGQHDLIKQDCLVVSLNFLRRKRIEYICRVSL